MKPAWTIVLIPVAFLLGWWLCRPSCCETWLWSEQITASSRFVSVFGGSGTLDKETGLVWQTDQDSLQRGWIIAREVCMNRNIGGRKGWRLPAFNELTSLLDPAVTNPALPAGHPFTNVQNTVYWSSSTSAVGVDFGLGDVSMVNKNNLARVKCVRGPMMGPTIY